MKVTVDMYKPTRDNLVVEVPELKKETESGIAIPDTVLAARAKERGLNLFIKVIAVGPQVTDIEVGDYVLCPRAPMELPDVEYDERDFKLGFVRELDVVGYVKGYEV